MPDTFDPPDDLDAADLAKMTNAEFRAHAWEAWSTNLPRNLRSRLAEADANYGTRDLEMSS
jgi:hypothetical protein